MANPKGGRQKGTPNKFPARAKLYEALMVNNFDPVKELIQLYEDSPNDIRSRLIITLFEYLFPKAKAEDSEGKSDVAISPEVAKVLADYVGQSK